MLAVFSQDAGGAEVLSSYIKRLKCKKIFFLKGQAIKIFKKKLPKFKNLKLKNINKFKIDKIITSTSLNKNHELFAIKYAKEKKIYSISILDNWINYRERFKKDNQHYFADEIWTVDKNAFNLAKKKKLPNIKLKKNLFLEDLIKDYKKIKIKKNKYRILYFDSTLKNKNKQKRRIIYFVLQIKKMKLKKNYKVYFRPHPSEKLFFYKNLLNKNNIKIIDVKKESTLQSIAKSNYIFGCNSMGMYISYKLKKNLINALPKYDSKLNIPIKIKSIRKFHINE